MKIKFLLWVALCAFVMAAVYAATPAATAKQKRLLADAISDDSQSWFVNEYVEGSLKNVYIQTSDGSTWVRGDYLYNGTREGWVAVLLNNGAAECISYWDNQDCRPIRNQRASSAVASGGSSTMPTKTNKGDISACLKVVTDVSDRTEGRRYECGDGNYVCTRDVVVGQNYYSHIQNQCSQPHTLEVTYFSGENAGTHKISMTPWNSTIAWIEGAKYRDLGVVDGTALQQRLIDSRNIVRLDRESPDLNGNGPWWTRQAISSAQVINPCFTQFNASQLLEIGGSVGTTTSDVGIDWAQIDDVHVYDNGAIASAKWLPAGNKIKFLSTDNFRGYEVYLMVKDIVDVC